MCTVACIRSSVEFGDALVITSVNLDIKVPLLCIVAEGFRFNFDCYLSILTFT